MRHPQIECVLAASFSLFLMVTVGAARAQVAPKDDEPVDPWAADKADPSEPEGEAESGGEEPPPPDPGNANPVDEGGEEAIPEPLVRAQEAPPPAAAKPESQLDLPVLFDGPTGHLLPAGVILSSLGADTGGGLSSDLRIGLGDVAEFGIGTTDLVRTRICNPNCGYDSVSPYPLALFKMGVSEDRLFDNQPAVALGFRKSFEREHDGRKTRIAELYLVASKSFGKKVHLHAGGVFWDASIKDGDDEVLLHDGGIKKQLRAFGGIELEPLPKSRLLLEVVWMPEFRLGQNDVADTIKLRPMFAWGVRYELTNWAMIESGVRIPDIQDINLLDAQIFGQVKIVSRRFSRFLEGLN
jgi:hypothetical protein